MASFSRKMLEELLTKAGLDLLDWQKEFYLRLVSSPPRTRTICGDVPNQSNCRCQKDPHGPEENHSCLRLNGCRGEWTYDAFGRFVIVSLPMPFSALLGLSFPFSWGDDD